MIDIERLAREAGFIDRASFNHFAELQRFAALVRNEALEEAAKCCDELDVPWSCNTVEKSLWDVATISAGDAIRALKDKK